MKPRVSAAVMLAFIRGSSNKSVKQTDRLIIAHGACAAKLRDQFEVIGKGMKQRRNTSTEKIARAIRARPSGSSSLTGGWPTFIRNSNTRVQSIYTGG